MNNIRAILSWSLSDDAEPADANLALELAGDLWFYWIHYTRAPGEARLWLTRALQAASTTSTGPRAKALVALGALEWRQGDYAPARQHLHESADIFRQMNDVQDLGHALHLAGHVHFEAREYVVARELYGQTRGALAEAGDVAGDLPLTKPSITGSSRRVGRTTARRGTRLTRVWPRPSPACKPSSSQLRSSSALGRLLVYHCSAGAGVVS